MSGHEESELILRLELAAMIAEEANREHTGDLLREVAAAYASLSLRLENAKTALRSIAEDDPRLQANEDAFSSTPYSRCREVARAALAAEREPA